jgi:hypothetical protein
MDIGARLRAAILLAMVTLLLAGSACSGGSSSASSSLTPTDVHRFVLADEATVDMTRLIALISAADLVTQHFAHQRPGTVAYDRFRLGARLSWNNVSVGLNYFTQGQALVAPVLNDTVGMHKLVATAWLNALDGLGRRPAGNLRQLSRVLAGPQKQELAARHLLNEAAAALAKATCALEVKHHELASAADTSAACGSARQLASAPST